MGGRVHPGIVAVGLFLLSLLCAAVPRCLGEQPVGQAKTTLEAKQLSDLWDQLADKDASKADAAIGKLIANGDATVAFLARQFAKRNQQRMIAQRIAELDAATWRTREAASKALRKIGPSAESLLREALKTTKSPEVRARAGELLAEFAREDRDRPEARRYGRAVKVLMALGSLEAFRATKAMVAVAPTHDAGRAAITALREIGADIVRSLLIRAEEKAKAGEQIAAVKVCRQALPVAVETNHRRKKNIRQIINVLAAGGRVSRKAWQHLRLVTVDLGRGVTMNLVLIPAGKFLMGSGVSAEELVKRHRHAEVKYFTNELPRREVTMTKPFYIGVSEVTQAQWQAVMGTEPWKGPWTGPWKGQTRKEGATSHLSWDDATGFCTKVSQKTGRTLRLPTEAEWEYACRAGSTTAYCFGDDASKLGEVAWYDKNAWYIGRKYAHPVRQRKPNAWGLYDMHGNVWEWCADYYDKDYYSATGNTVDPRGPALGSDRVLRGGCFFSYGRSCRSARRKRGDPNNRIVSGGFRVVLPVVGPKATK